MSLVETVAPELAIQEVLASGIRAHVPGLAGGVWDEDVLLERHKEIPDGTESRSGNTVYPFVSIKYEAEDFITRTPPDIREHRTSSPSLDTTEDPENPGTPKFEFDSVEVTDILTDHTFRVTIYGKVNEPAAVFRVKHQLQRYFALLADDEINPATYAFSGLGLVWFDPATGRLVPDQESPPVGAITLEAAVRQITGAQNETTIINEGRAEKRLAFTVTIGIDHVFERVVPDVRRSSIVAAPAEPAPPEEDETIPVDADAGLET